MERGGGSSLEAERPTGLGLRRPPARLDRPARAQTAVALARFGVGGLCAPTLLSDVVAAPLGLVVLLWLLVSAAASVAAALLALDSRPGQITVMAGDLAVVAAIGATTPGGYYPLISLVTLRLFQVSAWWGLRGAVVAGLPFAAAAVVWPSPQVTNLQGFLPLLTVHLAIVAVGLGTGWFARRQNALHDQTELAMALTFDHSPTGTVLTDGDGVVTRVNAAVVALCGVPAQGLLDRSLTTLVHPEDADALAAVLAGDAGDEVDVRLPTASGPHWVRLLVGRVPAAADLPAYLVVQAEDVHERRTTVERLAHEATHDALTGLPNRRAIRDALDAVVAAPGAGGALVLVDLDGFKAVNDRWGHEAGDALLVVVAERLRRAAREGDLAGRLAGDEMVLVVRGVPDEAGALAVGQRVLDELTGPADLGCGTVDLRASAGARWIGPDETDARQVMRDADAALYRAKEAGRGRVEAVPSSREPMTRTPSALREAQGQRV